MKRHDKLADTMPVGTLGIQIGDQRQKLAYKQTAVYLIGIIRFQGGKIYTMGKPCPGIDTLYRHHLRRRAYEQLNVLGRSEKRQCIAMDTNPILF